MSCKVIKKLAPPPTPIPPFLHGVKFKKYVRWGGEGGAPLKSEQKQTGGVLAYVYVRLKKNCGDFQNEVL